MCERAVKEKARSLGLKKAVKSRWMEHADYVRNHFAHRSYAEIGKELGISREYARRIAVRMGLKRTALEDFKVLSRIHSDIMRRERRRVIFGLSPITRIKGCVQPGTGKTPFMAQVQRLHCRRGIRYP